MRRFKWWELRYREINKVSSWTMYILCIVLAGMAFEFTIWSRVSWYSVRLGAMLAIVHGLLDLGFAAKDMEIIEPVGRITNRKDEE